MDENHIGMQIALFLLLAVGVALLATILALVGLIVASIMRALTGLIPRFSQRAKRLKEGSHELDELQEERSSKA
jgi:hypothetical protein